MHSQERMQFQVAKRWIFHTTHTLICLRVIMSGGQTNRPPLFVCTAERKLSQKAAVQAIGQASGQISTPESDRALLAMAQ
jgi:hypothetical protein